MAKSKKTIPVKLLLEFANTALARTDAHATKEYKSGICSMIEHALMRANAYNGYNHLYWLKQGFNEWRAAGEPDFPEKNKYIHGPNGSDFDRVYY